MIEEQFKIKYYSTSEIAKILNEEDSTIRYWCDKFKDILNIERQGTHRRFKDKDIKNLEHIKKLLRENGFTINQVLECYSHNKENTTKIKNKDELLIEEIVFKISTELEMRLDDIKKQITQHITNEYQRLINNQNENTQKLIDSVSTIIEEKLDNKLSELQIYQQLKIEQEKNKQLENIILKLRNLEDLQSNNSKKLKKNIFDIYK